MKAAVSAPPGADTQDISVRTIGPNDSRGRVRACGLLQALDATGDRGSRDIP